MIFSSAEIAAAAERCGKAAWFDGDGGLTASGERNQAGALTAAHRSLPFGTAVRVENLGNGRSVVVRVNDRGSGSRIISVSRAAAEKLGMIEDGVAKVRLSVDGEDRPAGEACGESLTVASAKDEIAAPTEVAAVVSDGGTARSLKTLPPVSVAITDDGVSGSEGAPYGEAVLEEEALTAAEEEAAAPIPDEAPVSEQTPISGEAMGDRFEAAFQPESWEESELRKIIEALLPRYWRRGSEVARTGPSASASVAIPWPVLDGFTQVSVSRVHIAELWSTELADPASARFERRAGPTAVSLLTE